MNRIILLTVVAIFVAIGGSYYFWFYVETENSVQTYQVITEDHRIINETKIFTGIGLSDKTLSWVETHRRELGKFDSGIVCDYTDSEPPPRLFGLIEGTCESLPYFAVVENSLLYVLYEDATASGLRDYSELANREFDTLMGICSSEETCGTDGFLAVKKRYDSTEDSELMGIIVNSRDDWVNLEEESIGGLYTSVDMLSSIYEVDNDPETLNLLLDKLQKLRNARVGSTGSNECGIRNSELNVYKATLDEEILNGVEILHEENPVVMDPSNELHNMIDCSNYLLNLYDITGKEIYKNQALDLFQNLIYLRADIFDGKTISFGNSDLSFGDKSTAENIQVAALGLNFHDREFEVYTN